MKDNLLGFVSRNVCFWDRHHEVAAIMCYSDRTRGYRYTCACEEARSPERQR